MVLAGLAASLIAVLCYLFGWTTAQKTIRFVNDFPNDITLMACDVLKYPLENYVDIKGAVFTIDSGDPKHIVPSINQHAAISIDEGTNVVNCESMVENGQDTYMICNGIYFVFIRMDPVLKIKTFAKVTALTTTFISQSFL